MLFNLLLLGVGAGIAQAQAPVPGVPVDPVDCTLAGACEDIECDKGFVPFLLPGTCCDVCIPESEVPDVDCSAAACLAVFCEGSFTLPGECCPRCPIPVEIDVCTDHRCPLGEACEALYPPCAPPADGTLPVACDPVPTCVARDGCVDEAGNQYLHGETWGTACMPSECDDGQILTLAIDCPPVTANDCKGTWIPPTEEECCGFCDMPDPCENHTCPENKVCVVQDIICVTTPCEPMVECQCRAMCPANYDPVCGSDGNTYSNECAAQAMACETDAVITTTAGECEDPCNFGDCAMPACPIDTYPVLHEGECCEVCEPMPPPIGCSTMLCAPGSVCIEVQPDCDATTPCNSYGMCVPSGPPRGCTSWFDGCNTCEVTWSDAASPMEDPMMACTEMACFQMEEPKCLKWVEPDCSVVTCAKPDCTDPIKIEGSCCEICEPTIPNCDLVKCMQPESCPLGQVLSYEFHECCGSCVPSMDPCETHTCPSGQECEVHMPPCMPPVLGGPNVDPAVGSSGTNPDGSDVAVGVPAIEIPADCEPVATCVTRDGCVDEDGNQYAHGDLWGDACMPSECFDGQIMNMIIDCFHEEFCHGTWTPAVAGECCGTCDQIDLCEDKTCPEGQHCEVDIIQCVTTPCDPKVDCVNDCDTMCPMLHDPVCTDDGDEYSNECFVQIEECLTGVEISYTKGACDDGTDPEVPPMGCVVWFDGCNTCTVDTSIAMSPMEQPVLMCTEMACTTKQDPECLEWAKCVDAAGVEHADGDVWGDSCDTQQECHMGMIVTSASLCGSAADCPGTWADATGDECCGTCDVDFCDFDCPPSSGEPICAEMDGTFQAFDSVCEMAREICKQYSDFFDADTIQMDDSGTDGFTDYDILGELFDLAAGHSEIDTAWNYVGRILCEDMPADGVDPADPVVIPQPDHLFDEFDTPEEIAAILDKIATAAGVDITRLDLTVAEAADGSAVLTLTIKPTTDANNANGAEKTTTEVYSVLFTQEEPALTKAGLAVPAEISGNQDPNPDPSTQGKPEDSAASALSQVVATSMAAVAVVAAL